MGCSKLKRLLARLWFNWRRKGLRERIFRKYGSSPDPEVQQVLEFLNVNRNLELPLGMRPPYSWVEDYLTAQAEVAEDSATGMPFTILNGWKVYFPKGLTPKEVQQMVRWARIEQDPRSPHCYLGGEHMPEPGDIGVFVGASDGMFCFKCHRPAFKSDFV